MRRWSRLAALASPLAFLLLAGPALAAPAPYTDWAFDVRRANDAGKADALAEQARKQPDFARVWFYGQIFDLVTVGLDDAIKAELRPRLRVIADTLATLEPPDPRPRLFLDWADTGRLAELAPRARELQDQWINAVRGGQPLPARLAAAEHPEVAPPVYYMLFFRAELASRRLGGDREKALLIQVARRMAEGFALAVGDVGPWRTLSAYMGQTGGVPLAGEGVMESQVGGALNAYLIGDLASARVGLQAALSTARQARSGSIFVALVMNGAAHAANWLGDYAAERALRVRVLQAVRPLQIPNLIALVADQMVRAHLADGSVDDMVAYTREMREMGDVVMRTGRHLSTMELAAEALAQTAEKRTAEGALEEASRVIDEARVLLAALAEDDAVAITTPSDRQAEVKRARQVARTELVRLTGRIAERRGRFDEARAAYGQVRGAYEGTLSDPAAMAGADLELSRVVLAAGDPDAALEHAKAAAQVAGTPPLKADAHRHIGRARLVRGEPAKAFAHANAGLRALRAAGIHEEHRPLRAALHVVAGAALDQAGLSAHVAERLGYAAKLAPDDPEIARIVAVARSEAGDVEGARAALEQAAGRLDGRAARILQSCALVRAGRHAEAIPPLKVLVPQLTLEHLRRPQIVGRTCLAAAYLAQGQTRAAADALRPARALILEYPDPMLSWRVHALDGRIAAAGRDWLDAAGAWRQAMDRFVDAAAEHATRGATVDLRTLAMPAGPESFADRLPGALSRSARKDRADAATHDAAALAAARWADLRALAPEITGPEALQRHPEGDRATRAAYARIGALRAVLADAAVVTAERVAAVQSLREAESALRAAVAALPEAAPRWVDYYSPSPAPVTAAAGEALLRYRIDEDAGHLWVLLPDQAPRWFDMPGRDALEKALAPARAALAEPPADWAPQKRRVRDPNADDWKALEAAARTVLPFLRDKALVEALGEAKLRVVVDGPLARFPLDALVVEAPPRAADGSPPAFFGARFDVTYALPAQTPGARKEAAVAHALFGPLAPAGSGCPDGATCGQADVSPITAAFEGAEGFATIGGAETTAAGLSTTLLGTETVIVASPVDLKAGAFVTSPEPGDAAYTRLGGAPLAEVPSGSAAVVALNVVGDTDAAGLRRLGAALRAAGTTTLVLPADPARAGLGELARRLAIGTPLRSAVFGEQQAMRAKIDPAVGGAAVHHPHHWARWVVFGAPMDRAALEAGVKPLPTPAPPPADPYADEAAPADGAAPAAPADPYGDVPAPPEATPDEDAPAEDAPDEAPAPPPVDPYG